MTTTAPQTPGLDQAPTKHATLVAWVSEIAALTKPDRVEWCDGSDEEWQRLTQLLVDAGTFVKLDEAKRPNSFYAVSDPTDVARVWTAPSSAPPRRRTRAPPTTGRLPTR